MKCLVFSDAHGFTHHIKRVISMHPDAQVIFFLGDGLREVDALREEYPDKFWVGVRGNCDLYSYFGGDVAEKTESVTLSGYKITATHGDLYGVKYGIAGLIKLAKDSGSDVVLFGHTHTPFAKYVSEYEKPFYLFNPGSVSVENGSFGILNLLNNPDFSVGSLV